MNIKIRYQFWRIRGELKPNKQFKRALGADLSRALEARYQTNYYWYQRTVFRLAAIGMLAALIIIGSGTGVYAYYNPEVIDGEALYPVKRGLEKAEELITVTAEGKAKLYLKKIQRREAERAVLEIKRQKLEKIDSQLKNIKKDLERAGDRLDDRKDSAKALKLKIKEKLKQRSHGSSKKIIDNDSDDPVSALPGAGNSGGRDGKRKLLKGD